MTSIFNFTSNNLFSSELFSESEKESVYTYFLPGLKAQDTQAFVENGLLKLKIKYFGSDYSEEIELFNSDIEKINITVLDGIMTVKIPKIKREAVKIKIN